MTTEDAPGVRLTAALAEERPLQIAGVINAYCALLAERAGFRALYVSGAGVANAVFGKPDLGLTTLHQVADEVRRITHVTPLPVVVDADTGWGANLATGHTVAELQRAGAAAMHLEDQIEPKRCGHRPGKLLVGAQVMCDRIKAAVDSRSDGSFAVMARTDAYAVEGLDAALERAARYVEAGADMVFPEALHSLDEYRRFTAGLSVPVLANMTEFGETPLFDRDQLHAAGVAMVLYPLTAFRAMSATAAHVYDTLRRVGHQRDLLGQMQTREELYQVLDYERWEQELDALLRRQEQDAEL